MTKQFEDKILNFLSDWTKEEELVDRLNFGCFGTMCTLYPRQSQAQMRLYLVLEMIKEGKIIEKKIDNIKYFKRNE